MRNRIRAIAFGAVALSLVACGVEQSGRLQGVMDTQAQEEISFVKTIDLVDDSGLNSATATFRTLDESLLKQINEDSFRLIPLYEVNLSDSSFTEDAVEQDGDYTGGQDDGIETEGDASIPMESLSIVLENEVMDKGVVGLEVVEVGSPTYRAPFKWRYEYSKLDCVNVTRGAFWHKVFTSIYYKTSSSSGWNTMVNYRKLGKNETLTRCASGSFKLKVGVYARQTAHYDVEFWN